MKISDLVSLGIRNLWRRKLRTILTVTGVFIGCASIVLMVSFGLAQNRQIDQIIKESKGIDSIVVSPTKWYDPSMGEKMPKKGLITENTIEELKKLPHVKSVVYTTNLNDIASGGAKIKVGKYTVGGSLMGMDVESLEDSGIKIIEGKEYNPNSKDIEIIVSDHIEHMLYDEKNTSARRFEETPEIDPMKEKFRLTIGNVFVDNNPLMAMEGGQTSTKKENYNLKVTGVYTQGLFGSMGGMYTSNENIEKLIDQANRLVMDEQQYKDWKKKKKKIYNNVTVYVDDINSIEETKSSIQEMELDAYSDSEWLNSMKEQGKVAQGILAGIGSISLIVAAIGITNTMVMSIYERTREIGVMKVIGASVGDIRNLFLFEAGMIGLLGGIIGLGISLAASHFLNEFLGRMMSGEMGMGGEPMVFSYIPFWLGISALVFSFLIGVVTGYYPARRATRLSAIEAIRTE
ncbi:MAG: ABC transporter permease [Tissierellia bacterium]|nr:ABC transporter permease [Tissierellia bacterium]